MLKELYPSSPNYEALSSDIVNNKIVGLEAHGAKLYITDTGKTYTVLSDYTLSLYTSNTSSIIDPTTGNAVEIGSDNALKTKIIINDNAIGNTNQIPTLVPCYASRCQITRSNVINAYSNGMLILPSGATTLPEIDLSASLGVSMANRKIMITSCYAISDNGANSAFSGYVDIFNVNSPTVSVNLADYAIFSPTAAGLVASFSNSIEDITNTKKYSTVSNMSWQTDITRKVQADVNGKIFLAPVCTSAYTPKANEVINIIIKYYLLN